MLVRTYFFNFCKTSRSYSSFERCSRFKKVILMVLMMEKNWLNDVLRNLCTNRADILGEESTYLEFETDESYENKSSADGLNSNQLYGKIIYKDERGNVCKSEPVVVKRALNTFRAKLTLSFSFINELNFYTKIMPTFNTLDATFSTLFPKFYHGEMIFNAEGDQSTLIFENLKSKGYTMSEKKSFLSYQHLNLMMRKLGQFHAYSYKAKKSMPNLFYPLARNFLESCRELNKESFDMLAFGVQRGLDHLQLDPTYVEYIPQLQKILENAADVLASILTGDRNNPFSVIVHGDYLSHNVMFKYENDVPNDAIMIDMATFRYGSPVIDLAKVLYVNADQDTRDKHWDSLVNEYYTALKETFVENEIPSKNEILSEFIDKSIFAYVLASFFLQLLITNDNGILIRNASEYHSENETTESVIEEVLHNGGEPATRALSNILKDMIDRKFICR
ncbi:uncharacterized protein LOC135847019 [Planococcus citri]|uniref:uncharacterized protein LOC135847019 n=1 Tax=Planococcus citri TaxID=170843 RepID=UPI0031FA00B3